MIFKDWIRFTFDMNRASATAASMKLLKKIVMVTNIVLKIAF